MLLFANGCAVIACFVTSTLLLSYCHVHRSVKSKVKFFPSHKALRTALISVSLALSQTCISLHYETMDTGLVYGAVCLFTPQLSPILIAPTHGGMARLS